ncbi:hypothetical protein HOLleu_27667 [Holothuria leucospilota]|uniref:Uncharacterized protein n=1 Tax=Holothuria leucospilota TaxID=206669 RepID=A0A9Q1H103_HOLLE|nr:hypothetical protein HOLleu_27667 [Holothuria leucospilota]
MINGQVSAKNYAKYLRQHEWTYSACGDDVVVVFVNMSKEVGMSCGTTTVHELEYLVIEDILRNAERIFKTQNITQSIVFIIRSLKEAFNGEYKRTPPFPVWTVVHMALGSSFVLCCFFSMYICRLLYSQ